MRDVGFSWRWLEIITSWQTLTDVSGELAASIFYLMEVGGSPETMVMIC
jgi:hypothetical protein